MSAAKEAVYHSATPSCWTNLVVEARCSSSTMPLPQRSRGGLKTSVPGQISIDGRGVRETRHTWRGSHQKEGSNSLLLKDESNKRNSEGSRGLNTALVRSILGVANVIGILGTAACDPIILSQKHKKFTKYRVRLS